MPFGRATGAERREAKGEQQHETARAARRAAPASPLAPRPSARHHEHPGDPRRQRFPPRQQRELRAPVLVPRGFGVAGIEWRGLARGSRSRAGSRRCPSGPGSRGPIRRDGCRAPGCTRRCSARRRDRSPGAAPAGTSGAGRPWRRACPMSEGRTSYLSVSKLTIRESSFTPLVIAFWHVVGSLVFTGGRLVSGVPDGVVGCGCPSGVGTTSGAGFLLQPARSRAATVSGTRVLRIVGPPEFRKLMIPPRRRDHAGSWDVPGVRRTRTRLVSRSMTWSWPRPVRLDTNTRCRPSGAHDGSSLRPSEVTCRTRSVARLYVITWKPPPASR